MCRQSAGSRRSAISASRSGATWPWRSAMRRKRERCNLGAVIGDERPAGFRLADLGDRSRKLHRHGRPVGDEHLCRLLTRRDAFNQIGVGQQRRTRQHHRRHFRLVGGKRADDLQRRMAAERTALRPSPCALLPRGRRAAGSALLPPRSGPRTAGRVEHRRARARPPPPPARSPLPYGSISGNAKRPSKPACAPD